MTASLKRAFSQQREQVVSDYLELLRFPSISADPQHDPDLRQCCDWVAGYLRQSGLDVEVWETSGQPVVFGQWLKAGDEKPTLLLYGHYDVQPVDPLDEWDSPPFEPRVDGSRVFARGAQDNKGQLMYVMTAIRHLLQQDGKLPVNLKICVEGEEETKSTGLTAHLSKVKDRLAADYVIIVDSGINSMQEPAVTLGARGVLAMTLTLRGSKTDLHSGWMGGVAYNPNHALVELLAKLRDETGRVLLPGFYDDVVTVSKAELSQFHLDVDEEACLRDFGIKPTGGESGYAPGESSTIRPTLEINGIGGGYSGPGYKTVIPARATAKVSCRLVPNQDPKKIQRALEDFFRSHLPDGIEMTLEQHGGASAVRASADSMAAQALQAAYAEVFERPCRFILIGGSVPVSGDLAKAANGELVFCGLALPTDQIHAPNEHFDIARIELGFLLITRFLQMMGNHGGRS